MRIALLGAGIFSRDCYLPCLEELRDVVTTVALWSRSEASVQALSDHLRRFSPNAACEHGEDGLERILHDPDVQGVTVVLPVHAAVQVVQRALAAGKHVLQEKPLGSSCAQCQPLVAAYRAQPSPRALWFYAENYRFESSYREALRLLPRVGTLLRLEAVMDVPITEHNKYYGSAWRRDPLICPGGYSTDVLVHIIGALRMMGAAAGQGEVTRVTCAARHVQPLLPAPDTLSALLDFQGGVAATLSATYAGTQLRMSVVAVGTQGVLEVARGGWLAGPFEYCVALTPQPSSPPAPAAPAPPVPHRSIHKLTGVQDEMRVFASAVAAWAGSAMDPERHAVHHAPAALHSPEQGLADLAVVEALIASSSRKGQHVQLA